MKTIEFWFDFSSPYAFFAARTVDEVASRHGRQVSWNPFLLGPAFNATGMQSLSKTPIRGDYARHDWARLARRMKVPFAIPAYHPVLSLPAARIYYWLEERDPEVAANFARRMFDGYYLEGINMSQPEGVAPLAAALSPYSEAELIAATQEPAIKEKVKSKTEEALSRGIFGSPFFVVDDEPFWGADRLPMIDDWLTAGGW